MKTKLDTITVDRDVLLNLCNAAERARAWMARNAPASDRANRVRADLYNAVSAAALSASENLCLPYAIKL